MSVRGGAAASRGRDHRRAVACGAASQQRRTRERRRARATEISRERRHTHMISDGKGWQGCRAHSPLSSQLDTPPTQTTREWNKRSTTRDREAATTARAHRSPRELAEGRRRAHGTNREVLGDDLQRHPVSRVRPFAVHEGHRVVGGRPVDKYEQRGQSARTVSPFFGRGECLSRGASGVVRPQFFTLWYGRAHG